MILEGKRILVTGGTGSLGKTLVKRLLEGELGVPASVNVFSRDEAKQHFMRLRFLNRNTATDEIIYRTAKDVLRFTIGDVRDADSVSKAVATADVIFHAAALKQVPSCEYHPIEAVMTNVMGADNVVRAVRKRAGAVSHVVGISTDKACKPVNVMGMTKALQERVFVEANIHEPDTSFSCVRYGNVIASRGSIVPLFIQQVKRGEELTVTMPEMTRFLLTLDRAVDTVFECLTSGNRGETYVPKVPAAKILDVAKALMGNQELPIRFTGIRPGEKIHEIMVSEEECHRTVERGDYYSILPMLPELRAESGSSTFIGREYSSSDVTLDVEGVKALLSSALDEVGEFTSEYA